MASTVFVARNLREGPADDIFTLDDNAGELLHLSEHSVLARAISPWGTDAAYNRFQVPALLAEVRRIATELRDDEARRRLENLADFVEARTDPAVDSYVIFLGD